VKAICGSDEPHPYSVRSFTYRTEQARADEVQRVMAYIMLNLDIGMLVSWSGVIRLLLISLTSEYNLTDTLDFYKACRKSNLFTILLFLITANAKRRIFQC
jgi:hypothetical protein